MTGADGRKSVVLNSWKEIASYLGRGVRTVQRWEADAGLPIHRPRGHARSAVLALSDEIDRWLRSDRNPESASQRGDSIPALCRHPESVARSREIMKHSAILRERYILLCSENKKALNTFLGTIQKLTNSIEESRKTRLASK